VQVNILMVEILRIKADWIISSIRWKHQVLKFGGEEHSIN